MGDFHKGSDFNGLPDELVRHLKLHRYIDGLTRVDDDFQTSRRRLDPTFRHGRSVLVDVFYDHILACRWDSYAQQPLADFAGQVYRGLEDCYHLLSPGLQQQLPRMIKDDWLSSYRRTDIVARVLGRLEQRLGGKIPLASGYAQLGLWRPQLEADFEAFMTTTAHRVRCWKDCH